MKSKLVGICLLTGGLAMNPLAYADADDDTMSMVDDGQTEEQVMEFVVHEAPTERAEFGTDIANMARDPDSELHGRDFGNWVSDQVRQDASQDIQQEAHRNARADLRGDNGQGGRPQ